MIKVFPDIEALNRFAAEKFVEIADEAIWRTGRFAVALSGGSTPKSLYQLLASEKFRDRVDWTKVFFFFGDERNVSPDSDESNYRMADENLFKPLNISPFNILRWNTDLNDATTIARDYEALMDFFFFDFDEDAAEYFPCFNLILLGMGADGHTASLFPYTGALFETEKPTFANRVEKLQTTRLTMTFPLINSAENIMFLVVGAEKAEALREVLQGEFDPDKFPAQKVKLKRGNLFWLVDKEAARLLEIQD